MQRLKILLSLFVFLGLALLVSYPWSVGTPPKADAPSDEKRVYITRLAIYVSGVSVLWFAASVTAYLMIRKIREEYIDESARNMVDLISSTSLMNLKDEQNGTKDS